MKCYFWRRVKGLSVGLSGMGDRWTKSIQKICKQRDMVRWQCSLMKRNHLELVRCNILCYLLSMGTEIELLQGEINHKLGWDNLYSMIVQTWDHLIWISEASGRCGKWQWALCLYVLFCLIGSVLSLPILLNTYSVCVYSTPVSIRILPSRILSSRNLDSSWQIVAS